MISEGKVDPPISSSGRVGMTDASTAESLEAAASPIGNVLAAGQRYLQIQADRARGLVRNIILFAILGTVAAIIAATVLVSAAVLFCVGLAQAITALLGGRMWAGDLIVGVLILAAVFGSVLLVSRRIKRASRERILREYEQQQRLS